MADLKERLAQCQTDKKAIEAQEQKLLDQIKEQRQRQKIPFARFTSMAYSGCPYPSLILHITPEFARLVEEHKGHVVSLGRYGSRSNIHVCCHTGNNGRAPTVDSLVGQYKNIQTLID